MRCERGSVVVVLPIAVQSVRLELMCTATSRKSLRFTGSWTFRSFRAGDVASRRLGRCRGDCKGSLRRSFGMFLIATRTMCSPVPALLLGSADLSSFVLECRASRERRASPQATIARKPEQQSASAWRMRGPAQVCCSNTMQAHATTSVWADHHLDCRDTPSEPTIRHSRTRRSGKRSRTIGQG